MYLLGGGGFVAIGDRRDIAALFCAVKDTICNLISTKNFLIKSIKFLVSDDILIYSKNLIFDVSSYFLLSPYCINTGLIGKVFPPEICKINSYLETGSKPVNTRAGWGLSQIGTVGQEGFEVLQKSMIYLILRLPLYSD